MVGATKAIGYLRVSTHKQGRSGLGLEAQRTAIGAFGDREGFALSKWFTDVETGGGPDALDKRPNLAAALKLAAKARCPIIVAKLDRLSRDIHFISGLMTQRGRIHRCGVGSPDRSICPTPFCRSSRERAGADLGADQSWFGSR